MSAWKRILIKTVLLLLVITLAGGGTAAWRANTQSTPEYAVNTYLSHLIDGSSEKAFALLDQTENRTMTLETYEDVLQEKKYSLYSGYTVQELETRRDNDGNEYTDYRAEFLNADGEVKMEEEFTVKKQTEAQFGIFDQWKVLSGHCMIQEFLLTVPAGSEVYLDNEEADASWITRDDVPQSVDCYRIPDLLPGLISLVIRHPALESVNTTLDTTQESAAFCEQMGLKQSAQDTCEEIAVQALKQLYSASALKKTDSLDEELFDNCMKAAKAFVKAQGSEFDSENTVFKNAAISEFAVQFTDPVFTEEENGAISTEMTLTYHYVVRTDVTGSQEEEQEDGESVEETESRSDSGENKAVFEMSYYEDAWHISSMDIPVIPES